MPTNFPNQLRSGVQSGKAARMTPAFWGLLGLAALIHVAAAFILLALFGEGDSEIAYIELIHKILASDANNWHQRAIHLVAYWRGESDFLWPVLHPRYEGYVGILGFFYYVLEPSLWSSYLLNALCCFFSGAVAFKFGVLLGQPARRMQMLALLVALWPPSLVYGAVTMRYCLWHLFILGSLTAMTALLTPAVRRKSSLAWIALGLAAACYFAVAMREYLAIHLHLMLLPAALLLWLGPKRYRDPVLKKRILWVYPLTLGVLLLTVQYPLGMALPEGIRAQHPEAPGRYISQRQAQRLARGKKAKRLAGIKKEPVRKKTEPSKGMGKSDAGPNENAPAPAPQGKLKTAAATASPAFGKPAEGGPKPGLTPERPAAAQKQQSPPPPAPGKTPRTGPARKGQRPSAVSRAWDFLLTNTWGRLMYERWAYIITGGRSQTPETMQLYEHFLDTGKKKVPYDLGDALRIIFKGVKDFLFFPWPWEDWPKGQPWMRAPVRALSILWYAMLPGIVWGMFGLARRNPAAAAPSLTWIMLVGFVLSVVVVNLGTLYRFRDAVFLVMLLYFDPAPYLRAWQAIRTPISGVISKA
jgi:hypothetical protein